MITNGGESTMYLYVTLSTGITVQCKINDVEEIKTPLNDRGAYINLETVNGTMIIINKNAIVCMEFTNRQLPM